MRGPAIEAVNNGLKDFEAALRNDPHALESAFVSIIVFESEAQQLMPLTEAGQFKAPVLEAQGECSLGKGLTLLGECLKRELRPKRVDHPGDWKPIIFLMTDGHATNEWESSAERLRESMMRRRDSLVVIGCGPTPNMSVLKKLSPHPLMLHNLTRENIRGLFWRVWWDDGPAQSTREIEPLPPPPVGITIDLDPEADAKKEETGTKSSEITRPRWLIYLLLEASGFMSGARVEAVNNWLKDFESGLKKVSDTVYVSLIKFGDDAQEVVPFASAGQFRAPVLAANGGCSLGKALTLLGRCVERDISIEGRDHSDDWKPVRIFLVSHGEPTDDWEDSAENLRRSMTLRHIQIEVIGCGPIVNVGVLARLGRAYLVPDLNSATIENLVPSLFPVRKGGGFPEGYVLLKEAAGNRECLAPYITIEL